ncbi:MAG: hypothetical protein COX16_01295 [Deltaproteobacteria bacterium CG23_combo_of_CG06-09_8_20_14_all_51_20]|nr:MAG: hypothetical protein COX16_01295 [Deltaproteobacteria bacterium CG23_combo_of_CG06-09_8_20_14_all_51_20]PJB33714.1 MAG: hypothetical protein CO107_14980 [Deltaproteobacteria bacterium CG_4_9_14_3_um_filter_51_14]
MATVAAPDTGEAIMQNAAIEKPVNNLSHIRLEEPILFRKTLVLDLFKSLEVVLHALIVV